MTKPVELPAKPPKPYRFTFVMDVTEYGKLVRLAECLNLGASEAVRQAISRTLDEIESAEKDA